MIKSYAEYRIKALMGVFPKEFNESGYIDQVTLCSCHEGIGVDPSCPQHGDNVGKNHYHFCVRYLGVGISFGQYSKRFVLEDLKKTELDALFLDAINGLVKMVIENRIINMPEG